MAMRTRRRIPGCQRNRSMRRSAAATNVACARPPSVVREPTLAALPHAILAAETTAQWSTFP
jgi:hypothetical protein